MWSLFSMLYFRTRDNSELTPIEFLNEQRKRYPWTLCYLIYAGSQLQLTIITSIQVFPCLARDNPRYDVHFTMLELPSSWCPASSYCASILLSAFDNLHRADNSLPRALTSRRIKMENEQGRIDIRLFFRAIICATEKYCCRHIISKNIEIYILF